MNPYNSEFKNRTASSPAIFNRCVIDWFGDWPESALYKVAKKLVKIDKEKRDQIVNAMVTIHSSV